MKDWQSVLIRPDTSLEKAIRILDEGALRIALVSDMDFRLKGTVTAGDLRGALLKPISLSDPVSQAMCTTPRTASPDWSRAKIMAFIEEAQILHLPVVDEEGCVIGLETLHGLIAQQDIDNPVFLMAGGFGTRLKPLTEKCPKPLLKVGDKPILQLILEDFIRGGFHRFYISTHYLPEMIWDHFGDGSDWGVSIKYIHEEEPLGTGGALGLLPKEEIDRPIIMMNGDLLTTLDYQGLLDFHADQDSIATMCVREYEYQIPYGVVQSDGVYIQDMREKPVHKCFINAGIYVVSPQMIEHVTPGEQVDMPTLLEKQINQNNAVTMFPVHEYWLDIGRMDDFYRAQNEFS